MARYAVIIFALLLVALPIEAVTICEIPNPTANGLDAANVCIRSVGCDVDYLLTFYNNDSIIRTVLGVPFQTDADGNCPSLIESADTSILVDEREDLRQSILSPDPAERILCRDAAPEFPDPDACPADADAPTPALCRLREFHRWLLRQAMPAGLITDTDPGRGSFTRLFSDCADAIGTNFWGTTGNPGARQDWLILSTTGGQNSAWNKYTDRVSKASVVQGHVNTDEPGNVDPVTGDFTPCPNSPFGCDPEGSLQ